jgi:signal peptidase I
MFEMFLFSLVVLCGVIILLCRHVFKAVPASGGDAVYISEHSIEPWYLDWARSFFPVLLIVFLLRGLVVEPFRIPSGSMLPTLEVGDFILVNKFQYGIRLPILHNKVIEVSAPQRGDIMVFRFPGDNKTNYIKRVIGLPGDKVEYRNQSVYVNGERLETVSDGKYTPFPTKGVARSLNRFVQYIPSGGDKSDKVGYSILLESRSSSISNVKIVPEGHYFVMGDNRDHSYDSRLWREPHIEQRYLGFVPEKNVVGKAFFIWFHWNGYPNGGFNFSRIGEDI